MMMVVMARRGRPQFHDNLNLGEGLPIVKRYWLRSRRRYRHATKGLLSVSRQPFIFQDAVKRDAYLPLGSGTLRRFFTAGATFFPSEAPFLPPFIAFLVAIIVHLSRKMGRCAAWILLPGTLRGAGPEKPCLTANLYFQLTFRLRTRGCSFLSSFLAFRDLADLTGVFLVAIATSPRALSLSKQTHCPVQFLYQTRALRTICVSTVKQSS